MVEKRKTFPLGGVRGEYKKNTIYGLSIGVQTTNFQILSLLILLNHPSSCFHVSMVYIVNYFKVVLEHSIMLLFYSFTSHSHTVRYLNSLSFFLSSFSSLPPSHSACLLSFLPFFPLSPYF